MKKTLAWILCAILALTLFTACGAESVEDKTPQITFPDISAPSVAVTEAPTTADTTPAATEAVPTEPAATEPAPTQKADDGALRSDFKEAMDAYEAAMNEYADFMEKYQENPTDLSLLKDYPAMMEKFEEAGNALDAWDSEDMNAAELAYYTAVVERVNKRLLSVGQ